MRGIILESDAVVVAHHALELLAENVAQVAADPGHEDLRMLKRYPHLKGEDLRKTLFENGAEKNGDAGSDDIEARLLKLKGLFEKGLIDEKSYIEKIGEILCGI